MKKLYVFLCVIAAVMMMAACGSSPKASSDKSTNASSTSQSGRKVNSSIPQSIRDTLTNIPEDVLIGVGTAKMSTLNMSRTTSQTRARAELSRQMDTVVRDMVRDYTAGSEVDPSAVLSFQENITVALSQAKLTGSIPIAEDEDAKGNYWTAVSLSKTSAVTEINQAVSAAKLKVPKMASFDAQARMDQAFDKIYGNEIGYSNSN